MGNVSMRDIGRKVGVSAVTVSKALAGRSGVSDTVRAEIIRVAEEMGYVNPNTQPRTVRSLDIGILLPERYFGPDAYYSMLYKHLVQALTDAGHFGML